MGKSKGATIELTMANDVTRVDHSAKIAGMSSEACIEAMEKVPIRMTMS